jgi:hypothetical protein
MSNDLRPTAQTATPTTRITRTQLKLVTGYCFGLTRSQMPGLLHMTSDDVRLATSSLMSATEAASILEAIINLIATGRVRIDALDLRFIPLERQMRRRRIADALKPGTWPPNPEMLALLAQGATLTHFALVRLWQGTATPGQQTVIDALRRRAGIADDPSNTEGYVLASVAAEYGLLGPEQITAARIPTPRGGR